MLKGTIKREVGRRWTFEINGASTFPHRNTLVHNNDTGAALVVFFITATVLFLIAHESDVVNVNGFVLSCFLLCQCFKNPTFLVSNNSAAVKHGGSENMWNGVAPPVTPVVVLLFSLLLFRCVEFLLFRQKE